MAESENFNISEQPISAILEQPKPTDDIATFRQSVSSMVAKNVQFWNDYETYYSRRKIKKYTEEEVKNIIDNGSLQQQQQLSRSYYYRDGFYKRILIYYATLLKYVGILIPNPSTGTQLSTPHILKRYNNALDYIDNLFLPELLTRISLRALIDGCYYGVIRELNKTDFVLLDLPAEYCRSNFKDLHGNDIIEFNVTYFSSITSEKARKMALKVYPKAVADHYSNYRANRVKTAWVKIPADVGICFPFFEDGRPIFLDIIPATIDYDQAVDVNKERDLEEIRKILVQKIPHLQDGTLLFEPPEAVEMHSGAVGMMAGNKNISVLTTYADVDAIVSKTSSEATTNTLEKSLQNIYSKASVSAQLFAPTGSQALATSITNDMSLMMILGNKYSRFITFLINFVFANSNIKFRYSLLPVSWYNVQDYIDKTLKMAESGYSFLLPTIAAGISQKDLLNLKNLENDVLKLQDKLIPLSSSYTQSSSGQVVRPSLDVQDKSPKTLQNEESLNKQ